jgi:4-amino-4-deoxy-L-arabinose transferase-like glycosyltransferase
LSNPVGQDSKQLHSDHVWSLGLLVAACGLWGINLGGVPLRDWDEGTYAAIAKGMYRTGNWLYPMLNGSPYLNKPPLLEWLIASSYRLFEVSDFTTRLPAAFLSACAVPLLYWVGRQVFSQRLPALFSAAVYLTLLPVVRHGRLAMRDGITVTFLLLLLGCLLKARHDRRWALGVGIALGLLGLTKGILALLLGAIAFIFLVVDRQYALLRSVYLWAGIALGAIPVLAWYAAQVQHYGPVFLQVHFLNQSVNRVWESVNSNTGPVWFYLLEVLKYTWPWLLFLPSGLILAWQKRQQTWSRLVLVGTVVYLSAVSVMTTKLPWYVMPLYPFLSLALGAQLDQLWQRDRPYSKVTAGFLGFLAIAGLAGGTYGSWADSEPVLLAIAVTVGVSFGWAAWWMLRQQRQFILVLLVGCYLSLGLLMGSPLWLWELNEAYPVKPVAALIAAQTPLGTTVYTSFPNHRPSLNFYSDRLVLPAGLPDLQRLQATQNYLLLDATVLNSLQIPNQRVLGLAEGFALVAPLTIQTP